MAKKELLGSEIAGFIQQRQATAVRSMSVKPKLAIINTNPSQVTDLYLRLKKDYADSIGAEVEIVSVAENDAIGAIDSLNTRTDIHGIIVQLPLLDPSLTDKLLSEVSVAKDVDGLSPDSKFDPATPTAILWLLASYNIDLRGKKVLVVGQGRLVGAPLTKMLANSQVDVSIADETTKNLADLCLESQIIITAVGKPSLITEIMVPVDAVVIDAGASSDNGKVVGDVDDMVRDRKDVTITPKKGGVGPLTVAALYENLLKVARGQTSV